MRRALVLGALLLSPQAVAAAAYDCVMDPSVSVRLASPVGGTIAEIAVARGEEIAKGQVVARLASTVERATVDLLEVQASDMSAIEAEQARLDFLQARLDRAESLAGSGIGTREAVEEIRAEVIASHSALVQARTAQAVARSELARARAVLERLTITAPIDGFVTERPLEVGEYLHPEAHVATIVRIAPLLVEAFLPVSVYGAVKVGGTAVVRPAPPVDGVFEAEIVTVDRVFDPASGTFAVRLELPNPDLALPGGHRCTLELGSV